VARARAFAQSQDHVEAFFAELGMELEGETQVEGPWVGRDVL
jgi:hypothetical protein